MKLFLIHKEWADYCILDNINNIISREKYKNDMGNYKLIDNNINLEIKWINWSNIEYFKKKDKYYFLIDFYEKYLVDAVISEYTFKHKEWSDTCILLENKNILFKKNNTNEIGTYFFLDTNLLKIEWKNWGVEYYIKSDNLFIDINNIDKNIDNIDKNIDNIDKNIDNNIHKNINNNIDKNIDNNIDKNINNNIENNKLKENYFLNIDKNDLDNNIKIDNSNSIINNKKIYKKINNIYYSDKYIDLYLINDINHNVILNYNKNKEQEPNYNSNLFYNLNKFNKNYINLFNYRTYKNKYFYNKKELINKFFNLKLPFNLNKIKNKDINKKKILTIAQWGYPAFGGGENWLLNMNKIFYNNNFDNYFICFSDPFKNKYYETFELIELDYVKIILMNKNLLDIVKIIKIIDPFLINHQGVDRIFFMKIANVLNIPFLTGFCFWNNILLDYHQNIDIIKNNNLIKDDSFEFICKNSYTYASSMFVNDVIENKFNKKIDVIETISLKEDFYIEKFDKNEQVYVTLINCHYNKGGFLLDMLCNDLNINIPILIIYTENDTLISKDTIIDMIDKRNKKNNNKNVNVNIFYEEKQNIKNIYKKTKILLTPSLCDETFCRVGYEGMMNNIPIISLKSGNLKYLLKDYALFLDNDKTTWKNNIERLYFSRNNTMKLTNKINPDNYQRTIENKLITKINNIDKSLYEYNDHNVGLLLPWADQGLGIQGRSYYLSLKEIGYTPFIFSFRPYHATYENEKLQIESSEWDYPNIYYSPNNREQVSYDEILNFVYTNKIKKFIFIEGTFDNIFYIAALLKIIGVELYIIINIECIRITEINYHYIFDKILCNNFNSYFIMNNLINKNDDDNNNNKVDLLHFHLEHEFFYKVEKREKKNNIQEKLSFVCCGGLNSISRKSIDKIINVFNIILQNDKNDKNNIYNIELNVYIQGIEIPQMIDNYKKLNININIIVKQFSYQNILKNISENDIFIHLGGQEGLGLGFYEALYMGLPILTLDWSPNNEIVKNNINGWLIKCDIDNIYENQESLIYRGILIEEYFINKLNEIINNKENTINIINNTIKNRIAFINKNKSIFNKNLMSILSSPVPNFD